MEFRVGDRVTAKGNMPGFEGPGTIDRVDASSSMYGYRIIYDCNPGCHIWSYTNSVKPLNPSDKILITSDGVTVTAKQFDGKKLVKTETAKCAPGDTYEFATGAKIAFDRLMNGLPGKVDKPMQDKAIYKAGDLVRVISPCGRWIAGDIVRLKDHGSRCGPDYWRAEYLDGHDWWSVPENCIEPYTEPDKPVKQPDKVMLYCTANGNGICHDIKKGDICEFDEAGYFHFPDGMKSCNAYKSVEDFCKKNVGYADAGFIPLVSRPAKVGEWVYIAHLDDDSDGKHNGGLKVGDIAIYVRPNAVDGAYVRTPSETVYGCPGDGNVTLLSENEYLVLSGYAPEPEQPKYYSGKVVCVTDNGMFHTKGKVYEAKNGILNSNSSDAYNDVPYESLDDLNNNSVPKFIPLID